MENEKTIDQLRAELDREKMLTNIYCRETEALRNELNQLHRMFDLLDIPRLQEVKQPDAEAEKVNLTVAERFFIYCHKNK